jgi:hypothetical protein
MIPAAAELSFEEAKERLELALQGYEHDVDAAMKVFLAKVIFYKE